MTVKELREMLESLPPDAPVFFDDGEEGPLEIDAHFEHDFYWVDKGEYGYYEYYHPAYKQPGPFVKGIVLR